jgi:hypothetical protein
MVDGNVVERQKNLLQIECLATEAITTAVRSLLPVKQILHDYLGDDQEEIEEAATVPEPELPDLPLPLPIPVAETSTTTTTTTTTTEAPSTTTAVSSTTTTSAVVSIDTEPSVHFAEYETVFDETKASPEIRYVPSGDDELESDGLKINENTPMQVTKEDFEDLDTAFNEDEVVVLE